MNSIHPAFEDFVPMFRGRVLTDVPPLNPARVASVGFLVSDKQAGPFEVEACSVLRWPDLHNRCRHAHPWFGPLDAHAWLCLAGIHQAIHRRQLERILTVLHSLYFGLAGVMDKFHYLKIGLGLVLAFVGVKMLLAHTAWKMPTLLSLGVVVVILAVSVVWSLLRPKKATHPVPHAGPEVLR